MKSIPNPWWIVIGAVIGLMVGNGPVMQFSFGIFVKPVSQALQVERGTLSAALMTGLLMTALMTPVVGRLVDRYGIRKVSLPTIALFGAGMAAIGLFSSSAWSFILLYGLAGIAAAGQTPLIYCKAVAARFDRRRGLALGIAIAGVGLGTALVSPFAQNLLVSYGWRGAYVGLGIATWIFALPAVAFLVSHGDQPGLRGGGVRTAVTSAKGLTAGEAVRGSAFWMLAFSFFLVAFAANGVVAHIVPLMSDRGIEPATATTALSAAGMALIVGRLVAGYLLDRIFAPYVAVVFFALPCIGIALLLSGGGVAIALPAAVLIGLGLGAEVDLIAYLQSRYIGLRAFGEIYGYLFAVFMFGSATGPFFMGMCFQHFKSYGPAMYVLLAALVIACFLVSRLGKYVFAPGVEPRADARSGSDPASSVAH